MRSYVEGEGLGVVSDLLLEHVRYIDPERTEGRVPVHANAHRNTRCGAVADEDFLKEGPADDVAFVLGPIGCEAIGYCLEDVVAFIVYAGLQIKQIAVPVSGCPLYPSDAADE